MSLLLICHCAWTEEPGGLWSMGSQRARPNWATEHAHTQTVPLQHETESSPKAENPRHRSGSRAPISEPVKHIERKCRVVGRAKALGPTRWCLMPAPQPPAVAQPAVFPLPPRSLYGGPAGLWLRCLCWVESTTYPTGWVWGWDLLWPMKCEQKWHSLPVPSWPGGILRSIVRVVAVAVACFSFVLFLDKGGQSQPSAKV